MTHGPKPCPCCQGAVSAYSVMINGPKGIVETPMTACMHDGCMLYRKDFTLEAWNTRTPSAIETAAEKMIVPVEKLSGIHREVAEFFDGGNEVGQSTWGEIQACNSVDEALVYLKEAIGED